MPEKTILDTETPVVCPATAYQSATVCVPITVTPYAKTGTTETVCCGAPTVVAGESKCSSGTKNGSCVFTITQDICVTVPVEFGATALPSDYYVTCNDASATDICEDCGSAE